MAGKISEYIQIAVKKASDLLDMTVDVGGGLLETRSITARNFFKPRTKTVSLTPTTTTVDFGFDTSASINITENVGLLITGLDNGGVYQLMLHADATPRIVTLGSSFGDSLTFEETSFTTTPNRTYLIEIFVSATGHVTHRRDTFIKTVAGTITGADEAVFKTSFGYFTRTLTAISSWIKSNLYTSEVLNDSNLLGADLNDVLNVADASEKPTIQNGDALALSRMNGSESENIFVLAENAKDYFGGASTLYVSTALELEAALSTEVDRISICVTKPISISTFPNIYPSKVYLTGCKISVTGGLILLNSSSGGSETVIYSDSYIFVQHADMETNIPIMSTDANWKLIFRYLEQSKENLVQVPFLFNASLSSIELITGRGVYVNDDDSTGIYSYSVDATLDLGQDDVRADASNVFSVSHLNASDELLFKRSGFATVQRSAISNLSIVLGIAGVWEFNYDNGDVLVWGDASKSGRFGIKVAFKFKERATAYECNLFPNTDIGTWVRFEHADWCINADNTWNLAKLNQSFTVKGFFDSVSDLTQSGNYSNVAGAGTVSENQQDDGTRYMQETQRIQRNDCTVTIGTNAVESTAEVWLLIHLSGTIL